MSEVTRRQLHAPIGVTARMLQWSMLLLLLDASVVLKPAAANPFPPYWNNGSGPAVHFAPVSWPSDPSFIPYTQYGRSLNDPRTSDPSNGGARPQNYVNVSSGCVDQSLPSVYYDYS